MYIAMSEGNEEDADQHARNEEEGGEGHADRTVGVAPVKTLASLEGAAMMSDLRKELQDLEDDLKKMRQQIRLKGF